MTAIVSLTDASVQFGRVQALQGVNLQIERGQSVALVGGNGSGKSTLLRLVNGTVVPSAVVAHSAPLPIVSQAFVYQKPFVLRASVLANVALAAWLRGTPWVLAKAQAGRSLQEVGLQNVATRQARTLSGGQQQRLAFARALVAQPELLLLDEPTASLAPQAKRDVELLMQQCSERGMTLLFASHNLGQVKRLASRVICLDAGRVVADMPTFDFFNKTLPPAAAQFMQMEAL